MSSIISKETAQQILYSSLKETTFCLANRYPQIHLYTFWIFYLPWMLKDCCRYKMTHPSRLPYYFLDWSSRIGLRKTMGRFDYSFWYILYIIQFRVQIHNQYNSTDFIPRKVLENKALFTFTFETQYQISIHLFRFQWWSL